MSKLGKILLFVGLVFLVMWFVSMRALSGNLLPFVWVLLGLGVLSIIAAFVKDFRFFVELSGQRTTKHGLNMGVLVLIVMAILIGVNFIGYRHVKKIDYTKEGLHSLSDQTKNILKSLSGEMLVHAFYTDNKDGGANQQKFKDLVEMYSSYSPKVKYVFVNPIKKPEEAKAFDVNVDGAIVIEYKGKKNKFDEPTEQAFTNAIIRVTREKNKVVYFMNGHGERDLESAEVDGAQNFKKYVSDSGYDIKPFNFVETAEIPADAAVLIIAGPKQPFLDPEIRSLKDFLYRGGKLFLALDPGTRTNLAGLTKTIGVEFKNNYILDQLGQMVGGGGATAVGYVYSTTNEVTKGFKQAMTIFHIASQLKVAPGKPDAIQVEEIVKSSPASFTKGELKQGEAKFIQGKDEKGPLTIVASVQGKMKKDDPKQPEAGEFSAIISGDSDFISNQLIDTQLNHDLAVNAVAFLAKDKELVSIRPKTSEGTALTITQTQSTVLYYGLVFLLPLLIFFSGSFVWFRRRMA